MNKLKTYTLLILAPVFWGVNFHLAKWAVQFISPVMGALIRIAIAAVLLLAIMAFKKEKLKLLDKITMTRLAVLSFLGLFCFNFFFMTGMKYTSAINGSLIAGLNPLMTTIVSAWLLRTRLNNAQVIGLILSLMGVLLVISGGDITVITGLQFSKGDIFMLMACLSFAFYNVLVKRWNTGLNPTMFATYTMIPAVAFFLLASAPDWSNTNLLTMHWLVYVALFVMSAFGTVLSYIFWVGGVRAIGADKASLFMNVVLLTAVAVSFLSGQPVSDIQLIGGVLIIAGVIIPSVKQLSYSAA